MTTSTLPAPTGHPHVTPRPRAAADRVPQLALVAPLLLFTHGILQWVDAIGPGDPARGDGGVLAVVAGGILVLAVGGFASLASTLAGRSARSEVTVPVTLLGAFGAGAAAAVWVGRSAGWLVDPLPAGLAVGGAVMTAVALSLALVVDAAEGRMPSGYVALAGVAGALLALPVGLEPLGALVLLIALGPLTRGSETAESPERQA
jgi:hypothetical protein